VNYSYFSLLLSDKKNHSDDVEIILNYFKKNFDIFFQLKSYMN